MHAFTRSFALIGVIAATLICWFLMGTEPLKQRVEAQPVAHQVSLDDHAVYQGYTKLKAPILTRLDQASTSEPAAYGYLGSLFVSDETNSWHWHIDPDTLAALRNDLGHRLSIPHPTGTGTRDYVIAKRISRGATLSIIAQAVDDPLDTLSLVDHKGAIVGSLTAQNPEDMRLINGNQQEAILSVPKSEASLFATSHAHHHDIYHEHYHASLQAEEPAPEAEIDTSPRAASSGETIESDPVEPVDMVIGYSQQAATDAGGTASIEARIIEAVDRLNDVLDDSGATSMNIELLATVGTADADEATDLEDDLNDLKGTGGDYARYDDIHAEFTAQGADLLHLIVAQAKNDAAGMAQISGRYGVTALDYMNPVNLTFCHEVGHNFGLQHAYGDGGGAVDSDSGRAYGIRFKDADDNQFRTIMAYDFDWTRIPRFSNPTLTYNGIPIGFPDGIDLTQEQVTINGVTVNSDRYDSALHAPYNGDHPDLGADAVSAIEANQAYTAGRGERPTIAVTAPTNGWFRQPGETLSITWTDNPLVDTSVDLHLYETGSDQIIASIASNQPDNGTFEWTIPNDIPPSSNYYVAATQGDDIASSGLISIASLADRHVEYFAADTFDLDGKIISFSPVDAATIHWNTTQESLPVDPTGGETHPSIDVLLEYNFSSFNYTLDLGWEFDFFGETYDSVHISSRGSLVLGESSDTTLTEDFADFFGRARIAPLSGDIVFSKTNGDFYPTWHVDANRLAVTWTFPTATGTGQAQCVIKPDGSIIFAYSGAMPDPAFVGLSPGPGRFHDDDGDDVPDALVESDFFSSRKLFLTVSDQHGDLSLEGVELLPGKPPITINNQRLEVDHLDPTQDHTWSFENATILTGNN